MSTISFYWVAVTGLVLICIGLVAVKLATRAARKPINYPYLFMKMFKRKGVDLQAARDETAKNELIEAVSTCSRCRNGEVCNEWLTNSENTESFRTFCPNAGLIEKLMSRADGDQVQAAPK